MAATSFALDENGLAATGAATDASALSLRCARKAAAAQEVANAVSGDLVGGSQTALGGLSPDELAFVVGGRAM